MAFLSSYSKLQIPHALYHLINEAKARHYEELYEKEADGIVSLEDVLEEILDFFAEGEDWLCHCRYIWMAYILGLAVSPTIKSYSPNEKQPERILLFSHFLITSVKKRMLRNSSILRQVSLERNFDFQSDILSVASELYKNKNSLLQKSTGVQSLDESLNVFQNLLVLFQPTTLVIPHKAKNALLEILDDCLQGYAIFPGSFGRRDLFNWWLLEVIPSSWSFTFPDKIYTINGLVDFDSFCEKEPQMHTDKHK